MADQSDIDAPVLWLRTPPQNRDRSARLTAEQIARTAFDIADREHLLAVSVKRVANRLKVPAARLEHYLRSRDELFDLMLDVGLGDIAVPDVAGAPNWRAHLEQLGASTCAVLRAHPSIGELIGGRPPSGPNGLRFVERTLDVLVRSGLDLRDAALTLNSVLAFVCGTVHAETRQFESRPSGDDGSARYLAETASARSYPRLHELFEQPSHITNDDTFAHGLAVLLDGIGLRIAATDAGRSVP